jgi:hypothetical protein
VSPQPIPPTNVRIVTPGRDPIPVECTYHGLDHAGRHLWLATMPVWLCGVDELTMTADVLPPHTAVGVRVIVERRAP